jgi:hypothetical protein
MEEITRLIESYRNSINSQDINGLIELRDRLAIESFYLAQDLSEAKRNYNSSYFVRKIQIEKSKQGFVKEMAYNKATTEALIQSEELYKTELDNESIAVSLDLLLKQVNKILDAIAQRVSYLRDEQKLTKQ